MRTDLRDHGSCEQLQDLQQTFENDNPLPCEKWSRDHRPPSLWDTPGRNQSSSP